MTLSENDLKCLENLPQKDLCHIIEYAQTVTEQKNAQEIRNEVSFHEPLVGKYYKENIWLDNHTQVCRYYKIISPIASTKDRVSALIFDMKPFYKFEYNNSKDKFLGYYNFESIYIEELPVGYRLADKKEPFIKHNNIENITQEEYETSLKDYIKLLLELKWPTSYLA